MAIARAPSGLWLPGQPLKLPDWRRMFARTKITGGGRYRQGDSRVIYNSTTMGECCCEEFDCDCIYTNSPVPLVEKTLEVTISGFSDGTGCTAGTCSILNNTFLIPLDQFYLQDDDTHCCNRGFLFLGDSCSGSATVRARVTMDKTIDGSPWQIVIAVTASRLLGGTRQVRWTRIGQSYVQSLCAGNQLTIPYETYVEYPYPITSSRIALACSDGDDGITTLTSPYCDHDGSNATIQFV